MELVVIMLLFVAILLVIGLFIGMASRLKELDAANAKYVYLEKKYDALRDFCIIKDGTPPAGQYFVFGYLNVMKNLDTQACYYISSSDISKCGCDVDGDIITIVNDCYIRNVNTQKIKEENNENK